MTVKLDLAGTPSAGPRLDRQGAEARKDRFMFEIERAAQQSQGSKAAPQEVPSEPARAAQTDTAPEHAHAALAATMVPAASWLAAHTHAPLAATTGAASAGNAAALAVRGNAATALPLASVFSAPVMALESDSADSSAPAAASATPDPAHDEQFAAAMLHVYQAEEGVHAFIRDASLGQAQARRVADAMAGQFALSGDTLAAITINGKRLRSSAPLAAIDSAQGGKATQRDPVTPPYAVKGA